MQLTTDLSKMGHTTIGIKIPEFQANESNAFTPIPGCMLEHIILTSKLSALEKLFYILVNSLSLINLNRGKQRAIALSAESWAKRLNCSKSLIFTMQKNLASKGYFIISKDKNKQGQNKRNLICPALPDNVFKYLSETSDNRVGEEELLYSPTHESKMQYLDRTKLFIIIGYQLLKDIAACEYLTPFYKLVWIDFYTTCYKARIVKSGSLFNIHGSVGFSFITSYQELQNKYFCNKSTISKTLINLEELGLIKREHFYTKKECGYQERQDGSLWKISLPLIENILSVNNLNSVNEWKINNSRCNHFSGTDSIITNSSFNRNLNNAFGASACVSGDSNVNGFERKKLRIAYNSNNNIQKKSDSLLPPLPDNSKFTNKQGFNNSLDQFNKQYINLASVDCFEDRILDSQLLANVADNDFYKYEKEDNFNIINYDSEEKLPLFDHPIKSRKASNVSFNDPNVAEFKPLFNKDFKTNTKIKNIDRLDSKSIFFKKSEFYRKFFSKGKEVETSNAYQSSKFIYDKLQNASLRLRGIETTNQTIKFITNKTLKNWYPLTREQVDELNSRSNREFSLNFANELLLKLSTKYPDHVFNFTNQLMSYLTKVFKYEKHQAAQVNHETFKFVREDEKGRAERLIENYLSKIEANFDTSLSAQLKRKIAASFTPAVAYNVLTKTRFILKDNLLKVKLLAGLNLSPAHEQLLSKEAVLIYGNEIEVVFIREQSNGVKEIVQGALMPGQYNNDIGRLEHEIFMEELDPLSAWYKIRKELQSYYGSQVDKAWFSKLRSQEDRASKKLILQAPTNFIRDWLQTNYGNVIEQYAKKLNYCFNPVESIIKV